MCVCVCVCVFVCVCVCVCEEGPGVKLPSLPPVYNSLEFMLETSNLASKYKNFYIPFSTKGLLILVMSAFFAENQRFRAKIIALIKAIV